MPGAKALDIILTDYAEEKYTENIKIFIKLYIKYTKAGNDVIQ